MHTQCHEDEYNGIEDAVYVLVLSLKHTLLNDNATEIPNMSTSAAGMLMQSSFTILHSSLIISKTKNENSKKSKCEKGIF